MSKRSINLFVPTVAVVVVALLGVLIGCQGKTAPEPTVINNTLAQPFTATVEVCVNGLETKGELSKPSMQEASFLVAEPEALSGFCFTYAGETVHVEYEGMSVDLTDDALLANGAVGVLMRVLNAAASDDELAVKSKGKQLVITGTSPDGDFTMKVNQNDGALNSLEVPDANLTCKFSDFTYKTVAETQENTSSQL